VKTSPPFGKCVKVCSPI